jgi:branched-chain amino acid transport system ATP-binding protein
VTAAEIDAEHVPHLARSDVGETEPVLQFRDVRLSFAGVVALDGVSFDVQPHELFAIIGPNGAGKTSCFNVLSGVYRPQEGRVTFRGEVVR